MKVCFTVAVLGGRWQNVNDTYPQGRFSLSRIPQDPQRGCRKTVKKAILDEKERKADIQSKSDIRRARVLNTPIKSRKQVFEAFFKWRHGEIAALVHPFENCHVSKQSLEEEKKSGLKTGIWKNGVSPCFSWSGGSPTLGRCPHLP